MRGTTPLRIAAAAAMVAALTSCAGPKPAGGVERSEGAPAGIGIPLESTEPIAYLTNAGEVLVVIWGSSSCRPEVVAFENADGVLDVDLALLGDQSRGCTADLTGTTYRFDREFLGRPAPESVRLHFDTTGETFTVPVQPKA
ncbi:hypothetical protein GCM10027591_14070 [Zhihengliuella somnathii]